MRLPVEIDDVRLQIKWNHSFIRMIIYSSDIRSDVIRSDIYITLSAMESVFGQEPSHKLITFYCQFKGGLV